MMEPVDTFEHAGLTVRIRYEEYDQEFANPRGCDGNLGVMFCDYQGYELGDADAPDPRDQTTTCPECAGSGEGKVYEIWDRRGYGRERIAGPFPTAGSADMYIALHPQPEESANWVYELAECTRCEGTGQVEVGMVEYLKREHGARVILPLFVYEHSGITIKAGGRLDTGEDNLVSRGRFVGDGAGWDTSTVGVIFDTAETRKAIGWKEDEIPEKVIEEMLDEEVAYYAAYLEGSVFGYEVVDDEDEVLDSCWGFLELNVWKDDAGVRTEARWAAEACAEEIEREKAEAHQWACRDVETV